MKRWNKDKPPKPDWYETRVFSKRSVGCYRWWNGKHWSAMALRYEGREIAGEMAKVPMTQPKGDKKRVVWWAS